MPREESIRPGERRMTILGAVIAGGRSSRFGSDKAKAMVGGISMLDHVIERLAAQTGALVICGRNVPGYICLDDIPRPGMGPLAGLAAALCHASAHGFNGVLTSACDTPLVPADLAQRLAGSGPAIVAGQPLFGYWPAHLSVQLGSFLVDPANRAVGKWANLVGARQVCYSTEIPNINTAAEFEALRLQGVPSHDRSR